MSKLSELEVVRSDNGKYRVSVVIDRCKECGFCIELCPVKVLVFIDRFNRYGYRYPVPVNINKCIGCRICEYNCPDFAIYVEAVEK